MIMPISFVCPVYHGEKTIRRAAMSFLDCVGRQEGDELVFVCDGNEEDASLKAIEDLLEKHKEIVFLYPKKRMGAMKARLVGIEHAKNDRIGFLDVDDALSSKALQRIHGDLAKKDYDILNYSFYIEKGGKLRKNAFVAKEGELSKHEAYKRLLNDASIRGFLWTKIFKKDLLLGSYLPQGNKVMFEDTCFTCYAFPKAKTFFYSPEPIYLYHKGEVSAITSPRTDRTACHLASLAMARAYLEKECPELLPIFFKARFRSLLSVWYDLSQDRKFGLGKEGIKQLKKAFSAIFSSKEKLEFDPIYQEKIDPRFR